jgi:Tfp pilus assembly protein PilF
MRIPGVAGPRADSNHGPTVARWSAALLLAATAACGNGATGTPAGAGPDAKTEVATAGAEGGFVGAEACRPCHAEIASTFARTGMGRSWYPMSEAPVVEDWTKHNSLEVPSTGLRYRMTRRDGKFFMRQSVADGRGGETAVDERELVWVIGSANHSRQYLIEQDGKMFQAPVCWQTQNPVWDLCPGYEYKNFYFGRVIGSNCVFCHNDRMQLVPGSRNAYAEPIPRGIGCERCHGPGERHVVKWEKGATPTGQPDSTIVNPKHLPPDLRLQICVPCHLGDSKATERVSLYPSSLEDWRPGRPITSAVLPFRFTEKTLHDFGLAGQVDRMILSRCYTESGGRMECLTCHNPHVTIFRKDRAADFFKSKCLGCHDTAACTAPAAARRATRPTDDCVGCHMRTGEPDEQHHVLFTDHWIRARIDDPQKHRTRFDVEPIFPESLEKLSPADRAFYTARAISLRAQMAPPDARPGMWPQAEAKFREAIGSGLARAEGSYFLGLSLSEQGKHQEAAEAFSAAYVRDPSDFDIAFAYGQSLLRQKKAAEAERVFETLARDHPEAAGPLAELARARADGGDYTGALQLFQKAAALEPWNASIRVNAASMMSALERRAEAIAEGEAALRLDPEGARTWNAYAMLLSRGGRPEEAEAAAGRARQLAKAPGLRMSDVPPM